MNGDQAGPSPTVPAPPQEADDTRSPTEEGSRIGRFQVRARLGAGSMGTVFVAYDAHLDRMTAIKLLHDSAFGREATERLLREARALARLSHPHVVQVHEVGEHEGVPFIAMEYVRGTTLRERIDRGQDDWRTRVELLKQCARGLDAAHEAGLVHRDFKPSNVMVGADGRVRVLDFGLVRDATRSGPQADPPHAGAAPTSPATGVAGTPEYMAPEQVRGERCTPLADQYALCVVGFELLWGRRPFDGPGRLGEPPDLTIPDPAPAYPPGIEQVVRRGLSTAPSARWPSMRALVERLEAITAEADLRDYLARRHERRAMDERAPVYGHETHLETLRARLQEAAGSSAGRALFLVRGEAGIGKTTLIRRALRDGLPAQAWLGSAKFSRLRLESPLGAFFAAIDGIAQRLDEERPPGARAHRRAELTENVGALLHVLADLCPTLHTYLESPPAPPPLAGRAQKNRLRRALEQFLGALGGPVVLTFDDMQWANEDCVEMVEHLLTSPDVDSLTVIVAFRQHESADSGAWQQRLLDSDAAQPAIELSPLGHDAVLALLLGHAELDAAQAPSLAPVLHEQTGGNPLRIHQLLSDLREEGSLHLDAERGAWRGDAAAIARRPLRLDVADLIARRIDALSSEGQRALEHLACAGGPLSLTVLAHARRSSTADLLRTLWPAIAAGLVRVDGSIEVGSASDSGLASDPPDRGNSARLFLSHDRIQQAAHERLDPDARARAHFALGQALIAAHGPSPQGAALFAAADQLNLGRDRVDTPSLRALRLRLNREAGARSVDATAYGAAVRYYEVAYALAADMQGPPHALLCALARARALAADYDGARDALEEALAHRPSPKDAMEAHQLALETAMLASDYPAGVGAVRNALRMHGLTLPEGERAARKALGAAVGKLEAALAAQAPTRAQLENVDRGSTGAPPQPRARDRGLEMCSTLPSLPRVETAWEASLHDLLGRFTVLAYRSSRPGMMGWAVIELCLASLQARSSQAGYAFAAFAFMLVGRGDYARAHALAEAGMQLAKEDQDPVVTARTTIVSQALIGHYYAPLIELADRLDAAFPACMDAGELVHASDLVLFADYFRLAGGAPLPELEARIEKSVHFFRRFAPTPLRFFYEPHVVHVVEELTGRRHSDFDPEAYRARHAQSPAATAWLLSAQAKLDVHFDRVPPEERLIEEVGVVERAAQGQMQVAEIRAYAALSLLHPDRTPEANGQVRRTTRAAAWQQELTRAATQAACNFAALEALVEAERMRASQAGLGPTIEAYERAIATASQWRQWDRAALAHRLYGRFWERRGNRITAEAQLRRAATLYRRWGADRVAETLLDA